MRKNINEMMQATDVFLLPSLFEGLPVTLIEAQAAGLKCFVSKETITDEVAITNLVHFISLNKSAESWADEILKKINYERKDMGDFIRKAGYDAKDSAKWVENFYINKVNQRDLKIGNKR